MNLDLIPLRVGHFRKIAVRKFLPRDCIAILADERDAYAGLKKVLFAATCIWIIAPRMARAPSIKEFKAFVADESPRMDYAISLVEIYHHHVMELYGQKRYGKPSQNKAIELIAELGIKHGNHKAPAKSRYLKNAWTESRDSIALLYAASTIETDEGNTLLEKIKLAENNIENDGKYIPELLSRAQFIVDEVLSRCPETETADHNDWLLPGFTKHQIVPPPNFTEEQREIIRRRFSRSAV